MMRLTAEDRAAIGELIAMHGHLCDDGDLEGLDAVCRTALSTRGPRVSA
jgi:hypothetical protein